MDTTQNRASSETCFVFHGHRPERARSGSYRLHGFSVLLIERCRKAAFPKPAHCALLFVSVVAFSLFLAPGTMAATLYSCRGDHGEQVFSSTKAPYHDCHAIGELSNAPQLPVVKSESAVVTRAKEQSLALHANELPPAPSPRGAGKPGSNGGRIAVYEIKLPQGQSPALKASPPQPEPGSRPTGGATASDGRMAVYKVKLPGGQTEYSNLEDEAERGESSVVASYFPLCFACDSGVDWDTVPLHLDEYQVPIEQAVLETGISESMLRAVLHAESDFNIHARSSNGGKGISLLNPDAAMSPGVHDPSDPSQAILAAARRLVWLRDRLHGQLYLELAAYNKPVEVIAARGMPNDPQLKAFVRSVMILQPRYEKALPSRPLIPRKIIVVGGKVVNKGPGVMVGRSFLAIRPASATTSPAH